MFTVDLTVDGSSAISETQEAVSSRDGGMCVLCGMYIVDIAHIIAPTENYAVDCIRRIAPSLSDFRNDDASNLICLCPTHHREFDSGGFVFVPSESQRDLMLKYEERDFAMREESIAQGREDPGRTFPKLITEFDYIPVIPSPFRFQVHNPTPHDYYTVVFDNEEQQPCPLLHFQASHFALMMQAVPRLFRPFRVRSSKGDKAGLQITSLLRLYERHPRRYSTHVISVPGDRFCEISMPGLTRSSEYKNCQHRPDMKAAAESVHAPSLSLQSLNICRNPSPDRLRPR